MRDAVSFVSRKSSSAAIDEYVLKTYFPGLEAPEYLKILAEY